MGAHRPATCPELNRRVGKEGMERGQADKVTNEITDLQTR